MDQTFPTRRGTRARALAFLVLTAVLAAGCGADSGGGITAPPVNPPPPPPPPPPADPGQGGGPAPVGTVMYAVDLSNNFLVFGTGSIGTPTMKKKITGLPILNRIIGLVIRPSDKALIGIGNDSRVYKLNPLTAQATALTGAQFTPTIASFFDIHFAMALEPNGQRVRLIAAESGGNWSVDITTGTATLNKNARYGDGSPYKGKTPRLLGLVYPTLPASAKQAGWCPNLAYAIDADEAIMIASCDPAKGWWYPTGLTPPGAAPAPSSRSFATATYDKEFEELKDQLLRCGEFMESAGGSNSEGEEEPVGTEGGPWFPQSPDTEFYVFLVKVGELQNRSGTVKLIDGQKWGLTLGPVLPSSEPVQSVVFDKGGPYYGPSSVTSALRQVGAGIPSLIGGNPEPPTDPRASCTSGP